MAYLPTGTVYGVLLNFRGEWDALGAAMHEAPYKAPPQAPVLYVKPANTFSPDGAAITLPAGASEVEVGATVAMVMHAPGTVGGYVLMNDLSLPQASFYRPPVRLKCADGFLGVGARVVPASTLGDPSTLTLQVRINGELRQSVEFAQLLRPAAQLLADVGEFMTLGAGDVLMLGCDAGRPRARAGDRIEISAPGLGTLTHTLVAKASP